ncbi:MAG: glutathione S-transferase N-terminal domain-containing protein [Rickettsiales bacterium]|jgi:glutathione S-transferase
MKLYYTHNSPYARRPRMAIREAGLLDRVEEVDASKLENREEVMLGHGPGNKVPGLLTDSGAFICETLLIDHALDDAAGGTLYPKAQAARDFAFELDGIASLLMESLFYRSHENRREDGEKSQAFIDKEAGRAARAYDALEARVDRFGDDMHLGLISIVASLGYADWRHPGDGWRDGRPKLTAWFEKMMERPAMAETKPIF